MTLLPVITACMGLMLILALWLIPKQQVRTLAHKVPVDRVKELENEFRKTIAQIVGGLLILVGSYLTWQGILASRQKETTDRFTAAISHLASKRQTVQIGGIYTFGRIMRDSPTEGAAVISILSAFVRDQSAWKDGQIPADLKLEIQAAVSVISQRPREVDDQLGKDNAIDFSNTDLRKGQFAEFRFAHARMLKTHLDEADLDHADLQGAELQGSFLDGANLRNANLHQADLTGASIEKTDFKGADLSGIKGWTEEEIRKSSAFVDKNTVF